MKTIVLAIITLLCSLRTIYAFGSPEEKYKVLQKGEDRIEIEVLDDCDIFVADIAPVGKNKIYGDKVGGTHYGGATDQYFNNHQVTPNMGKKGIKIHRNSERRVVLSVKYTALENTEIEIVSAVFKDSLQAKPERAGYFPGNPFKISVKKGGKDGTTEACTNEGIVTSLPEDQTVNNTFEIKDLKEAVEGLKQDVSRLKQNPGTSDKVMHDIFPIFLALLVGLVIGYYLFKRNRKVLKKLSKDCSDLRKVIDVWELKNNNQVASDQNTQQKNKEKNTITDDDIKRFIVEQIKSLQTHSTIAAYSNLNSVANPVKKEEQTTDTDNVKYHQDDKSFSLEQTDIKIFRIYSKKGEYYYTIVDDSAVREELIGMLQMFEGCITYQTTNGVAKRVEPVTDGKLRKDGNKFYVDVNNKLVVKFA